MMPWFDDVLEDGYGASESVHGSCKGVGDG